MPQDIRLKNIVKKSFKKVPAKYLKYLKNKII